MRNLITKVVYKEKKNIVLYKIAIILLFMPITPCLGLSYSSCLYLLHQLESYELSLELISVMLHLKCSNVHCLGMSHSPLYTNKMTN